MAATAMLMAAVTTPAGASLTSMTYGMPSVFQTATTTGFSRDLVSATNFENVDINFGAAGLAGLGCGFGGFPSISQTVEQTYFEEHTDFFHTEETAAFNYPFLGVGSACGGLPGLSGLSGYGLPYGIC